jgi:hypothetical protein
MSGIACASAFCDFDEAEGGELSDCRGDGVAVHPIFLELLERDREPAVVLAAVVTMLDLDPRHHEKRGPAEDTIGRRLQHFDQPSCD